MAAVWRKNLSVGWNYLVIIMLVVVFMAVSPAHASPDSSPPAMAEPAAHAQQQPEEALATATEASASSSYLAEITDADVYVRSGPAEIYYPVGKLQLGQQIVVLEERAGKKNWAKIQPTGPCFSYISKKYVKLAQPAPQIPAVQAPAQEQTAAPDSQSQDQKDDQTRLQPPPVSTACVYGNIINGTVTGDFVRVRAGSIKVPPQYANQVQVKLSQGEPVQVIGERDEYYMILTPPGGSFWVAMDFVKKLGSVTSEASVNIREQNEQILLGKTSLQATQEIETDQKAYQEIVQKFEQEQDKPILNRDLSSIRAMVTQLQESAQSPSIRTMVENLERVLARAEMAQKLLQQSLAQDQRLQRTLVEIDQKVQLLSSTQLPSQPGDKDIVAQGKLTESAIFQSGGNQRRYLLVDPEGTIEYYVISGREDLDLGQWLGKDVSLIGQVDYDSFGKVRIVKVQGIVEKASIPALK